MAKKKKRPSSNKQPINVKVSLPKEYFQGATKAAGERAGQAAVGLIVTNPIVAIIAAVIIIALLLIIGGFVLTALISHLTNPWMWALAVLVSMGFKPKTNSGMIGSALLVGLVFFVYDIYIQFQAMQNVCNIPFIGIFICGAWQTAMVIPWIISFLTYFGTAFIMMSIASYVRYQLLKR